MQISSASNKRRVVRLVVKLPSGKTETDIIGGYSMSESYEQLEGRARGIAKSKGKLVSLTRGEITFTAN